MDAKPILEAPAVSTRHEMTEAQAEQFSRDGEPLLATQQIQGNIFPGFSKDNRTLLFLRISNVPAFRGWLEALIPFIATTEEVLSFNRLFKMMRFRRQSECNTVKATWINIAFSFAGISKIAKDSGGLDLGFKDEAFVAEGGIAARSKLLGDPTDKAAEGNPNNWRVGGTDSEADFVLIVESDSQSDLFNEVERIENTIFAFQTASGAPAASGVELMFKQNGATLPGSLTGHEHFGFRDGVSQPGIRGRVAENDFLTPNQNPNNLNQGKPGQDLLWPGEFVFGYPGQNPKNLTIAGKNRLDDEREAPEWARNGSYLVFRRLRQDVGRFHQFLHDVAGEFGTDPALVGARLVGRWASGAPVVRSGMVDQPDLAENDCVNNNFEFDSEEAGGQPDPSRPPQAGDCPAVDEAPRDPLGQFCPFAGHIRKSYPRNDRSKTIKKVDENTTQTHRLLRRGMPWGPASASNPHAPLHDNADRGLLFMCYQTSLTGQFEFVTQSWVNNADFKTDGAGHDMIIGQNPVGDRHRTTKLLLPDSGSPGSQKEQTISTKDFTDPARPGLNDWVIPTGGGYFFAPSIDGLHLLAGTVAAKPGKKLAKPPKKPK